MLEQIMELAVVISAVDRLTGPIKQMSGGMGAAQKQAEGLQKTLDGFKSMAAVGGILTTIGIAGERAMTGLANVAGDVQMQMKLIQQATAASRDEMARFGSEAVRLSSNTLFSQQEIGGIELALSRAGLNSQRINAALTPATYLAEYENLKNKAPAEESAFNFASMAEQMGISNNVERMNQLADTIARVGSVTHMSLQEMRYASAYSAPVLRPLGYSDQQMIQSFALLSRFGIEGSSAGEWLKATAERASPYQYMFSRGGDRYLSAMNNLGLLEGVTTKTDRNGKTKVTSFGSSKLLDQAGNLKALPDIVALVVKGLEKYKGTPQENARDLGAITGIFGEQGQRIVAMIRQDPDAYKRLTADLARQASLEEKINELRATWVGQTHVMESNIRNIGKTLGDSFLPILTPIAAKVAEITANINAWMLQNPEIMKWIGGAIALATGLALVLGPIMAIGGAIGWLVASGAGMAALSGAVGALAIAFGWVIPIILGVVAAVVFLVYAFKHNLGGITTAAMVVWDALKQGFAAVVAFFQGHSAEFLGAFKTIFALVKPWIDFFVGWFTTAWDVIVVMARIAWNIIVDVVKIVFNLVAGVVSVFIDVLSGNWKKLGADVQNYFGAAIRGIESLVVHILTGLGRFVVTVVGVVVKAAAEIVAFPVSMLSGLLNAIANIAGDTWAGRMARSGAKGMEAFAAGIRSGGNDIFTSLQGMFDKLDKDLLPHSDARTGPLSRLTWSGMRLAATFAQGITQGSPQIYDAVTRAFGTTGLDSSGAGLPIPSIRSAAPPVNVQFSAGAIVVQGAPGQSADEIAEAVWHKFGRKLADRIPRSGVEILAGS